MEKLQRSVLALSVLVVAAAFGACACDRGSQDTAAGVQATDAPTPGGAKAATYSPAEVCFSNEAFDQLTRAFPEQPEEPAPAPAPPPGGSEAALGAAAADSVKNAEGAAVPMGVSGDVAAAEDNQDATEIEGIKVLKGRKDYCCHSPTGGAKPIRASHTASAILKCKKHAPLGWVSKGGC